MMGLWERSKAALAAREAPTPGGVNLEKWGTPYSTDGQALADAVGGTADSAALAAGAKLGMKAPGLWKIPAVGAGAVAASLASQFAREATGAPNLVGRTDPTLGGKLVNTGIDSALMALPEIKPAFQAGKQVAKERLAQALGEGATVPGAAKLLDELSKKGIEAPLTTFMKDDSVVQRVANLAAAPEIRAAEEKAKQDLVERFLTDIGRGRIDPSLSTQTVAGRITRRAQKVRKGVDDNIKSLYDKFNSNFRDTTVYPLQTMEEVVVPATTSVNAMGVRKVIPATKQMVPKTVDIVGPIDVTDVIDDVRGVVGTILDSSMGEGKVTLKASREGTKILKYLDQVLTDEKTGRQIASIDNLKGLREELFRLGQSKDMSRAVKGEIRGLVGKISQAELDTTTKAQFGWPVGSGDALTAAKDAQKAKLSAYRLVQGEGNKSIPNALSKPVDYLNPNNPNVDPEVVLRASLSRPEKARSAIAAGAKQEDLTSAFLGREMSAATDAHGNLSASKFLASMRDKNKREVFDTIVPPGWKEDTIKDFTRLLTSLDPKTRDTGGGFLTYKKGSLGLSLLATGASAALTGTLSPFATTGAGLLTGITFAQRELPKLLQDPEFIRLAVGLQQKGVRPNPTPFFQLLGRAGVVGIAKTKKGEEIPVAIQPTGEIVPQEPASKEDSKVIVY
jgi:hypothetical protein